MGVASERSRSARRHRRGRDRRRRRDRGRCTRRGWRRGRRGREGARNLRGSSAFANAHTPAGGRAATFTVRVRYGRLPGRGDPKSNGKPVPGTEIPPATSSLGDRAAPVGSTIADVEAYREAPTRREDERGASPPRRRHCTTGMASDGAGARLTFGALALVRRVPAARERRDAPRPGGPSTGRILDGRLLLGFRTIPGRPTGPRAPSRRAGHRAGRGRGRWRASCAVRPSRLAHEHPGPAPGPAPPPDGATKRSTRGGRRALLFAMLRNDATWASISGTGASGPRTRRAEGVATSNAQRPSGSASSGPSWRSSTRSPRTSCRRATPRRRRPTARASGRRRSHMLWHPTLWRLREHASQSCRSGIRPASSAASSGARLVTRADRLVQQQTTTSELGLTPPSCVPFARTWRRRPSSHRSRRSSPRGSREPGPGPGRRGRRRGGPSREGDDRRADRLLGTLARRLRNEESSSSTSVLARPRRTRSTAKGAVVVTIFQHGPGFCDGHRNQVRRASSSARSNHRGGGRPTRDIGNAFGSVSSRRTCSSARRTSRSPFACGGWRARGPRWPRVLLRFALSSEAALVGKLFSRGMAK